jgi:hypothetical protein
MDLTGGSSPASVWAGRGYSELPYTVVQDFSLFIVLRQPTTATWTHKLVWIAERGGMSLLNTHPDYMSFGQGVPQLGQFPVAHYIEFLRYVRQAYPGAYWHVLPRHVAAYVQPGQRALFVSSAGKPEVRVWRSGKKRVLGRTR